ncbi:reprolysin-like metallopeptidase [Flavobacterium sp. NKUCC04_CG]|uniref:zinc-dependent metalloprotease n=1 Tax=Flavobacterium sp. NKUCC04_CG TaxID=2842121 RepID=UPI001C5A6FFE|nr:zinc-dependent metalloprotease family protein [Flavobacterium sp. NKUCC04_CG]MBW3520146.1 T9SS type A sorting domain-containing protein [Flavobacterium sp. NKUCC04_CG]
MKNKHLWNVFFILILSLSSQAQNQPWKKISEKEIIKLDKKTRVSTPSEYEIYQLDLNLLTTIVQKAPLDLSSQKSTIIMDFPTSDGKLERFEIYQAPVMSPVLSGKFPDITSYSGKSLTDPTSSIRFSITVFGFQAVHYAAKTGTSYIDAYTSDLKNYIFYNRKNLKSNRSFECFADTTVADIPEISELPTINAAFDSGTHTFREYRLAMACTIEFAAYHINQARISNIAVNTTATKKAAVLSAMVATMTRVNFIYERDLSIRMNLIDNNDEIIFIDSDEFSNSNANQLLRQSQTVINRVIGALHYDIGHTVSTGGGGVARLQSPCNTNIKAMGITGSPEPTGDPFDVDFVAHEMGHQFGATHTFNSSCNDNVQEETAVEPGSGSTIMAYAGVCAPSVQSHSDPFFHSVSIAQINAYKAARGNCSDNTFNEIELLQVDTAVEFNIPFGTPFKLTGNITSNQLNNITYSWEQTDTEFTVQPPVSSATSGPSFRVFEPTLSNIRYFPKFENVLSGANSTWEVLPNVARTLNFNLLARDNNIQFGGQTSESATTIYVQNVGPFVVTSPSAAAEWQTTSTKTVTWNVAGTTANNINSSHVNILFSADNGASFITLIENTPNDGSENIVVPESDSDNCRILIEPVGNVYYALSQKFKITGNPTAGQESFDLSEFSLYPNPTNGVFNIKYQPKTLDKITISVHDLAGRMISHKTYNNNGDFNQEIDLTQAQTGVYLVSVQDGQNKQVKRIIKK